MQYIFSLITIVFIAGSLNIKAQDFEVAPVELNFNAEPGEIQIKKVTVRNHSNKVQGFTFTVGDYETDGEGKKKRLAAGTSKRSLADWVTVNPSFLELNPNEEFALDVMITVPTDGYSTRWGMLYIQAAQEKRAGDIDKELAAGIRLLPRIVVMLNQSPKSNNNYKAKISNLREVTAAGDSTRSFAVDVRNVGDKIIEGKIYLALANLQTAKEERFDPVKTTILPDEMRTVTLSLPNTTNRGKYALAAILDYGHRSSLEGTQITIDLK